MKFLRGSERVPERHLHRGEPWTAPRALTAASRAGRPWGHIFTVREEDYVILNLDFYRAVRGGPHPAPGGPPEDHERKRRAFLRTAEGDRILSPREKHKGGQKLQERRELRERNVGAVSAPRGPSGMNRPAEGGGRGGGSPWLGLWRDLPSHGRAMGVRVPAGCGADATVCVSMVMQGLPPALHFASNVSYQQKREDLNMDVNRAKGQRILAKTLQTREEFGEPS